MSKFLPIFILSIFADVVCSNSIARIFDMQVHFSPLALTVTMLILQMLAAPLQAGFSDFYLRKKGLMIALICSVISLLFSSFVNLPGLPAIIFIFIGLIINSSFGNIIPIVWSALADEQKENLRFSLALTTCAYPIGYILLALLALPTNTSSSLWLWEDVIIPSILLIICFILTWKFFRDSADKKATYENKKPKFAALAISELSTLSKELKNDTTRHGLLAYFLWAASQYSSLLMLVNLHGYTGTVIVMMCGYFFGVLVLAFCRKIRDEKIIKSAFVITISAYVLFFVFLPMFKNNNLLISFCFFFYTLGNAFLTPSIFSLFSKEREIHEQGKGFGLIVAADSAGFLIGVIAQKSFFNFKVDIKYLVLFSFFIFLVSWFPYVRYEKKRKNAPRISHHSQ